MDGHQPLVDPPGSTPNRRASLRILSRNINQVVLGNMLFETWYYSPYPDNIILSKPSQLELQNGTQVNGTAHTKSSVCSRLHVCPLCFAYSPQKEDYLQHLAHHELQLQDDADGDILPVPTTAFKVYEWEGYAVWEIDGEKEKLYCQNLSLFGKLFLEQKSVFFDTGGFKYYVLTQSPLENDQKPQARGRKRKSSSFEDNLFKTRVLGFFSKEDLSWDSNNLACILIFPPFQHRQLGQLLMAVSYKLSGWEWEGGVIGGPEKPLSTMGRRSYLRFWSERLARFMMGQTTDADQQLVFDSTHKKRTGPPKEEMTVKEIGDRTGMLAEDVVAALNEMGICDLRPHKRKKKSSETNGISSGTELDDRLASMTILRSGVLAWAETHSVDLMPTVREEGFLGEWALSDLDEDNEDDEDGHDGQLVEEDEDLES